MTPCSLWKFIIVSEECVASIFTIEVYANNRREAEASAIRSSEMSVNFYWTTRRHVPKKYSSGKLRSYDVGSTAILQS
jgi:hypothetical protein